jgi:hypothetical protein
MNTQDTPAGNPFLVRLARLGPGVLIPSGIVLLVLITLAIAWALRRPIAEQAVRDWCKRQDLTCEISLARLDPGRVEITTLGIAGSDVEPIRLNGAVLDIGWPGLFRPEVRTVTLQDGVVRGRYGTQGFDLHGLEKLIPERRDTARVAMPAVDIPNLRVEIETSAGPVVVQAKIAGRFPDDFQIDAEALPVSLARDGDRLDFTGGFLRARMDAGVPVAEGALRLSRAQIDGLVAENVILDLGTTSSTTGEGPQSHRLTVEGSTGPVALGARQADLLRFEAQAVAAPAEPQSPDSWLSGLSDIALSAEFIALDSAELMAERVLLDARLSGDSGSLAGPVLLALEGVVAPQGALRRANLTGNVGLSLQGTALDRVAFEGGIVGEALSLGALLRMAVTPPLKAGDPLRAHGEGLRSAVSNALADFTTGLDIEAAWTRADGLTLRSRRASQLTAKSGLRLSVTPTSEHPWLLLTPASLSINGDLNLSGGGLPEIALGNAQIALPGTADGPIAIAAAPMVIAPWTAGGLTLSLDADALSLRGEPGRLSGEGLGEIRLDGSAFGLRLSDAVVFGGIRAVQGDEGWRIVMQGTDCVALRARAAVAGNLAIGPFSLSACPDEGRVLRREGDSLVGGASLSDVVFSARTPDLSAGLNLANARADWTLKEGLSVRLTADRLDAPVTLKSGDVRLRAQQPVLGFDFTPRQPRINAAMRATVLSGSLIPANVEADALSFEGRVARAGLDGTGRFTRVGVSDLPKDALYEPLRLDGDFALRAGALSADADIVLAKSGRAIATGALKLDLATLDGTLSLAGQRLEFQRKGLQPSDLSDRVRGLFTDATGAVTPRADLVLRAGALSGTAEVLIEGLSFQTFRLGSITGISGRVTFDDIVRVRTAPGQTLTLAEVNPGIPLRAGRIRFQLLSPTQARLEDARWPFAGGELVILPTDWTVQGASDTVNAEMRAISLSELVALLKIPDLKVEGTASGRFPIVIRGAEVRISGARLKADETGGNLQYTGATADTAGQAGPEARLTFEALRDFDFSLLEIGVDGNVAGNLTVTVRLLGRNPAVLNGRPFDISVSVDSPLMRLLESGVRVFDAGALTDAARNGLLRPTDPR